MINEPWYEDLMTTLVGVV